MTHILSVAITLADKPGRVSDVITIYPGSQNASLRSFWPSGEEKEMAMLPLDQLIEQLVGIEKRPTLSDKSIGAA